MVPKVEEFLENGTLFEHIFQQHSLLSRGVVCISLARGLRVPVLVYIRINIQEFRTLEGINSRLLPATKVKASFATKNKLTSVVCVYILYSRVRAP